MELIDKYGQIYNFKENIKYKISAENKGFLQNLEIVLEEEIFKEIVKHINYVKKLDLNDDNVLTPLQKTRYLSKEMAKILPALMSLSPHKPRPEARYFLEELYGIKPSIAFLPDYNYLNIDYTVTKAREKVKTPTEGKLVFMPIVAMNAPELWVGLAHEVAHFYRSLINEFIKESKNAIDDEKYFSIIKRLDEQLEEIFCDLFALKTIHSCYYMSFILTSLLEGTLNPYLFILSSSSDIEELELESTHPIHAARVEIMKQFLENHLPNTVFKNLCDKLYSYHSSIKELDLSKARENLGDDNDIMIRIEVELELAESYGKQLCKIFDEILKNSDICYYELTSEDLTLAHELAKEVLDNHIPVGTYKRININEALKELKRVIDIEHPSKEDYNTLFNMLKEYPTKIAVLFNVFYLVKINHMKETYKELEKTDDITIIMDYIMKVKERNELFLKSIEDSVILEFYHHS